MLYQMRLKRKSKVKSKDLLTLNKRTPFWKPFIFVLPAIAVLGFFTIYPFFLSANYALHPLTNSHDASSATFGWSAFTDVFHDKFFMKGLTNSLLYAFLMIPISLIISIVISAAITSLIRKRAKGAWQTIFFLPYVTSGVAVSMAFFYLFDNETGMINHWFGLETNWLGATTGHAALFVMVLKGVWSALAFQILIFTTAMMGVDKDRYKAASIDGAGPIRQFFSITLPSIKKTTSFLITVGLIGAIKVFPLALFNNDVYAAKHHGGSTLMLFVFDAISNSHFQVAGAASIILVVISIAFSTLVKNSFNFALWSFQKGGEWRVQNKITNSLKI